MIFVEPNLGHNSAPGIRHIVARNAEIEIAIVVVVGPSQVAVVHAENLVAVDLVDSQDAPAVAVELGLRVAVWRHTRDDQIYIAIAIVVAPSEFGIAHTQQSIL